MEKDNNKIRPVKNEKSQEVVDINEVLKSLPKEKRELLQTAFLAIEERSSFSGPLPPPEDFAKYEEVLPGATDRILKMAEEQSEHRMYCEKKMVECNTSQSSRGQLIGALLVALCLIMSFVLGLYGHDELAKVLGLSSVISVSVVFVLNKLPFFNKQDNDE